MPLPWKKSKSGRISRLVSDLQQSPKHGGSLFVETGFPTSLIHLLVKNRDRLKKSSSKRNNKAQTQTAHTTRPRVLSPPLPQKLDPAPVTEDLTASKIDESLVNGSGSTSENRHDGDNNDGVGNGGNRGGGCCVLMVVVLALSTKKVAVGITILAFALLFLELAVARVFTLIYPCPDAKLIGKKNGEERKNKKVSFEIIESFQDSRDCIEEIQFRPPEEGDVVLTKEKSKSAKLKSKIVPNKLRSYMKKKKKDKQEAEGVEVDDESVTEVSSFYSEDRIESQISERDETASNPPKLLESCEEEEESGSKGDLTKVIVLIVISLAGLFCGKVLAIALTLSWCLILRFVCCKSQTSSQHIKNKILLC
ncbi:unnamed protein product [Brassica rapa]|uniref:Ethylene-responsive nuclear protein n=2 Tax=Brassica TaxID=3705 RepID=A0A3P6BE37_BRACM|nr:uncharacterized protein LOC111213588 [Brassica napus]CAF2236620.1 unnamed protein product [Brassica napus]CAG7898026.1 unnamed protein product [Brassica rapa]VDD04287.1 unnamed protein product [Brassica rapa]